MASKAKGKPRTGGQILVDQLVLHGADTAYCVPGESYLEVLDALHDVSDRIALINARHEAGAANMAEAYGKLTGRPGICMVTRGPGACQASVGVHTAAQDSTPMILLVGQVGRPMLDREAFQEIDYRRMFGSVAKWVAEIGQTARIPEYIARAFRVATSGRPGPVVLALPEDMLREEARVDDALPYEPVRPTLSEGDVGRICEALAEAERPMLIVGGSGWDDGAAADITTFAETNGLPVAATFRRQDIVDNRSEVYIGDFGTASPASLVERMARADLLLIVGARMGEMSTKGYKTLSPKRKPGQVVIHLHADANEIGRVFAPDIGLAAHPAEAARALFGRQVWRNSHWEKWRAEARAAYLADIEPPAGGGALDLGAAFAGLREVLPEDFIVTLDAGNHTGWPQRFLQFTRPARELGSTSGAMGYAVPAAVAASIRHPERLVFACVGDGGFMMSGLELATAAQHGGKPIVLVFNNGIYGTIRMHQETRHPYRVSGTTLENPDFCAMAEAMHAHAERVETTEAFLPAFQRAVASGRPALLELVCDPEQITTRTTIADLHGAGKG